MTKKKLPNYKAGDIVCKGISTCKIVKITKEPTAEIHNIVSGQEVVVTFPELATYEHYPHSTRIGRPPKTKPREAINATLTEHQKRPDLIIAEDEQASTPETKDPCLGTGITEPGKDYVRITEDKDKPNKVDLSTYFLRVGTGNVQHKMSLSGEFGIKEVRGKDLKPTLLRLLEQVGITTDSDALLISKLTLEFPDSSGRNQILDILKASG